MLHHLGQVACALFISSLLFTQHAHSGSCANHSHEALTILFINGVFNKDQIDVTNVKDALTNILTKENSSTDLSAIWEDLRFNYIWQTTVIHWWKIHKIFIDFAPWDAQSRVYQVASENYFNPDQTLAELRRLGLHPSQRPDLYDISPGTTLTDAVIKQALEDTLEKSYREVFSKEDIAQPGRVHSMHHLHHWIDLM